jgi:hypothetical protein
MAYLLFFLVVVDQFNVKNIRSFRLSVDAGDNEEDPAIAGSWRCREP